MIVLFLLATLIVPYLSYRSPSETHTSHSFSQNCHKVDYVKKERHYAKRWKVRGTRTARHLSGSVKIKIKCHVDGVETFWNFVILVSTEIINLFKGLFLFFFFCSTTTRGGFWPSLQGYSTPFYFQSTPSNSSP